MSTLVSIDGLPFYGTDTGEVGTLRFTTFDGWWDSPSVRGSGTERPAAQGEFDEPVYHGARLILMSGWTNAADVAGLWAVRTAFRSILGSVEAGPIDVDEDGIETGASVHLYGDARFARIGSSGRANWSLKLRAPDPCIYGATHTEGPDTSVDVSHAGNFSAVSSIEVVGTMPSGYTVTDGTAEYVVTQALAGGQTHRIDMATGWLYLNDVLQAGAVQQADTWVVPKATTVTHTLVPVSGSGTITVTVRDTYM